MIVINTNQGTAPVTELGDFLRSRRDRLTPEDVGVRSYGRRRVPGLRREELAQLAGVSVTYLTRLEQGQSQNASDAVIGSLARALQLSAYARKHLFTLARPPTVPPSVGAGRSRRLRKPAPSGCCT
ncbi:MAG: helix-turn-helix domain-containing protein [Corynebacterium nuruki]|nr:helix-turn-helix domain-containing protein [Corynebacterium nuruki]